MGGEKTSKSQGGIPRLPYEILASIIEICIRSEKNPYDIIHKFAKVNSTFREIAYKNLTIPSYYMDFDKLPRLVVVHLILNQRPSGPGIEIPRVPREPIFAPNFSGKLYIDYLEERIACAEHWYDIQREDRELSDELYQTYREDFGIPRWERLLAKRDHWWSCTYMNKEAKGK